ncbi:neutral zinc metallopeptidase [Nonomuraea solani]|uniref:neutral zinc metallopeptidase n=1 Tax=Nonomuraea solani TaxID=1144553 RepID=UPI00135A3758|nr:neutral zinc metallopeptidase [Nonomuraea solani]
MKPVKIAALACALITPFAATTAAHASAYPVKNPVLTKNALYESGRLPLTTCDELPVEPQNQSQARTYITEVLRCLENAWGPHLKKAGLPYEPVKVRYVKRMPKNYCGDTEVSLADSQAWYCDWDRMLTFQLGSSWLTDPSDLNLFSLASSMYGYHVQKLVGIYDAGEDLRAGSKAEHYEQSRRHHLQMECLGGVFMQSVWPIKGRTKAEWDKLVALSYGDWPGQTPEWGKTATVQRWMRAGFKTGDPGSCNTWAAPSSKVA